MTFMISKNVIETYRGPILLRKTAYNLYLAPHPLLRPYISNYTISFPEPGMVTGTLTIIPDASGCFVTTFNGTTIRSDLWGATSRANMISSSANNYAMMMFVEFHPYGMYHFTRIDQSELANRIFDLDSIDREICSAIRNAIEKAAQVNDLVRELDRIFIARMIASQPPAVISNSLELITTSKGQIRVSDLSRQQHYSERHLNRLFHQQVGMNPKLLLRLVRLNHAVRLIQKPHATLLKTALLTGFFDEPHLMNEFKDICAVPIHQYLENMSVFYNETLKI